MKSRKILASLAALSAAVALAGCATSAGSAGGASHGLPLTVQDRADLKLLGERIAATALVRGSFTQTRHIEGLTKDFISKGGFIFNSGTGVYWNVASPFPATYIFSEKGTWQTVEGKTTFVGAEDHPFSSHLSRMIEAAQSGDMEMLEKYFELSYSSSGKKWSIGFRARDKRLRKVVAEMTVSGDGYIRTILIKDDGNNTTRIAFDELELPEELTPIETKYFER